MPSTNILTLKKQTGTLLLDEKALHEEEDMNLTCAVLLQEHRPDPSISQRMFRSIDGQIQIYDGQDCDEEERQDCWGNRINLWGYRETFILDMLQKHLTGDGVLYFIIAPEGRDPSMYTVTSDEVEMIA